MKVGNLYSLKSFRGFGDEVQKVMKGTKFSDAYNGVMLERNMTHVDPTIFEKKYPDLVFFNLGIDADNSGGYAKRVQSLRVLGHGEFADAGDKTSNKGRISLSGEDSDILVYQKEAFAEWTKTEAETLAIQNINLSGRLIQVMDEQYKREIDAIGFVGVGENKGLLNNADFVTTPASNTIDLLSAQQMYDEFANLLTDQFDSVSNTEEYMANSVVMPTNVLNVLKVTILDSASSPASVLSALQANFPSVSFMASFRCKDVGGSSVTCAFNANPQTMKMRIPTPLEIGEVFKLGSFHWKTDAQYRIAGLDILEKTAGRLLTGL